MNITLKDFQIDTVNKLLTAVENEKKEVILKSPTGSGKTIMLANFINEFINRNANFCFIWLTPGKGNLEEQSKNKMDCYFPTLETMLMSDIMTHGLSENSIAFVNWELVTKKGNNALADSERDNLIDKVKKAKRENLKFIVIVDEEHLNQTYKANEIIELFRPESVIRTSATPTKFGNAELIEVKDETVIAEGLIKKMLYINEGVENGLIIKDQTSYLLDLAIKKQSKLREKFLEYNVKINPLIVIQMPNNSDAKLQAVEEFLETQEITYENKKLAIWLSDKKENLDRIEDFNADPVAIIIKQAVATGWDCTRAHILVKLRDNMDETFETQTIGRIRRMPEAKHYECDLLDVCYLYTFDEKFTQGVKQFFGNGASEVKKIYLKKEYSNFKLIKYYNPTIKNPVDPTKVRELLTSSITKRHMLKRGEYIKNKKFLSASGFDFNENISIHAISGKVVTAEIFDKNGLNSAELYIPLNTHIHGRDFHKAVGIIGASAGIIYEYANTILRNIFTEQTSFKNNLLNLTYKQLYAFIINNKDLLIKEFVEAITDSSLQTTLQPKVNKSNFIFPREFLMTYNPSAKINKIYDKNVYDGYINSVVGRSRPEVIFEQFCQNKMKWFYKNGESSQEFFSIVYNDNAGKQRHFYPDYIIMDNNNNTWIIETKGGESISGQDQNIDKYAKQKFDALLEYGKENKIKIGFVRFDDYSNTLFLNNTSYCEKLKDGSWEVIENILK